MRVKRIFFFAFLVFIFGQGFLQARITFYVFGCGNYVNSVGDESDYEEGENDFPITSSHQTYGFGLGIVYNLKTVFVGLEANYNLKGKATLTDPSDGDTVEIDTLRNFAGLLNLGLIIIGNKRARIFLNGGVGLGAFEDSKTRLYTSQLGYETRIEPPEKKYFFTGFGGGGVEFYVSSAVGFLFNVRYFYFALEKPQTMAAALAGLILSF